MACLPHRLRKGVNFNRMCEMFIVLRCVVFLNFSTHLICKYSMFVVFSGLNRGWFFSLLVSVAFFICIYIFKHLCVNLNILNVNVWIWVLCKVASIHQVCSRLRAQHIKSLFLCDNGVCVLRERKRDNGPFLSSSLCRYLCALCTVSLVRSDKVNPGLRVLSALQLCETGICCSV